MLYTRVFSFNHSSSLRMTEERVPAHTASHTALLTALGYSSRYIHMYTQFSRLQVTEGYSVIVTVESEPCPQFADSEDCNSITKDDQYPLLRGCPRERTKGHSERT